MIRLEDPAGADAGGTIISTDPAGAHPQVWNNLTIPPWTLVRDLQAGFNVVLNPAGVQLVNVNALAPSTVQWGACGLYANGYFLPDIEGHLYLTMHVTGFTGPTDTTNGDLNTFIIGLTSRIGAVDNATTQGLMMIEFGKRSAVALHLGEQKFCLSTLSNVGADSEKSATSDAVVADEFELELRLRPAGLGAPQSATINCSVIDWVRVKRWVAGVAQADLSFLNLALGGTLLRMLNYSWAGFHVFFGSMAGESSRTVAGTITQIGMSRGRFVPYA